MERLYCFCINELRESNGCENIDQLSTESWHEYIDDIDEDCSDSDDEYQVRFSNIKKVIKSLYNYISSQE